MPTSCPPRPQAESIPDAPEDRLTIPVQAVEVGRAVSVQTIAPRGSELFLGGAVLAAFCRSRLLRSSARSRRRFDGRSGR